jgi:hypothetical protein
VWSLLKRAHLGLTRGLTLFWLGERHCGDALDARDIGMVISCLRNGLSWNKSEQLLRVETVESQDGSSKVKFCLVSKTVNPF